MTDQRYTGLDGVKRLEMLEELARVIKDWGDRPRWAGNWPQLNRIVAALDQDNERVSRLKEKT